MIQPALSLCPLCLSTPLVSCALCLSTPLVSCAKLWAQRHALDKQAHILRLCPTIQGFWRVADCAPWHAVELYSFVPGKSPDANHRPRPRDYAWKICCRLPIP